MQACNVKAQIRREMRMLSHNESARLQQGIRAAESIQAWPIFKKAKVVGCFASTKGEIDTKPLLAVACSLGKTLALPKVTGTSTMDFFQAAPDKLVPGAYGILEPPDGAKLILPNQIDLLLIPAQAVDAEGWRLGQGGGYYDRYLPKTNCPVAAIIMPYQWGICFPHEPHDCKVMWCFAGGTLYQAIDERNYHAESKQEES